MRFGLCCKFVRAPIKFRTTTATHVRKLTNRAEFLSKILLDNAQALEDAIQCCDALGIKSFRVTSKFSPLYTHPELGYSLDSLPAAETIYAHLKRCKRLAQKTQMRLTLHPDQFVVLNSPHKDVLKKSIQEIEYHTLIANLIGADVINIHGGGVYGDKKSALDRFEVGFHRLSSSARAKITLENDDRCFTPSDLLPLCHRLKIPFVYDIHHHRCLPDSLSEKEATAQALRTWNREPLFHLSSPLHGWGGPVPNRHHDYIDLRDFPMHWLEIDPLTIEIEAKAKELAILRLIKALGLR